MDPGDNDEPSREELEGRVAELEQTVSKMLPDRRGVIKGLGAAALGGAAVGASTGGASGQTGPAGQVGTPENPNDMFAWDLDVANEVVTDLDLGDNELRSGSVNTEVGSFNERYAASFSGSDMGLKTQAALDDLNGKGVVYLPAGSYTVSSTILLSEGQYLVGAGADATVLELAAGANTNLIEFSNGGNLGIFGGVRDLQLDGNRANNSSGHAIYSNGDIIDGKIYNCFIEEVADDCVHLEASASRWMVAHNHLENSSGRAVYVGGASGIKVHHNHIANLGGVGIFNGGDTGQWTQNRIENTGDNGLVNSGGTSNVFAGGYIKDAGGNGINNAANSNVFVGVRVLRPADHGVREASGDATFSGCVVREAPKSGYLLTGETTTVTGGKIKGWGSNSGEPAFDINASDVSVNGIAIAQNIPGFSETTVATVAANNCEVAVDLRGGSGISWSFIQESGAGDAVFDGAGLSWTNVTDNGERAVVNGVGFNSGDPSQTGVWNGDGYAGPTVYDSTASRPYPAYEYVDGEWQAA